MLTLFDYIWAYPATEPLEGSHHKVFAWIATDPYRCWVVLLNCQRLGSLLLHCTNYLLSPWLALGRAAVWNPEAGVQLTPIESVVSQDSQVPGMLL